MTRWCIWFHTEDKVSFFKLVAADNLEVAEMMGNDLASRNKSKVIGIIVACEQFNVVEK